MTDPAPDESTQQTLSGDPDRDDATDDAATPYSDPDTDRETETESDGLFGDVTGASRLIKNQSLLEVGMVPDEDRIVGRDNEIELFASYLRPIIAGGSPTPLLIYGKTGTGKSLVSQHVSNRARKAASRNGRTIAVAYIDCSQHSTETQAACALARELNHKAGSPERIPLKGLGTSHYYTYVWDLLDRHFDGAITILDEIDRLQPDDDGNRDNILMQLSRARESGKTTKDIGIVGISNKIDWGEQLNQRVRSSLGNEELIFPPYDANQLREIMRAREDAFHDGVLEDDVIPKAAALAAKEHGDARKAIRILKNAGMIAENQQDDTVRREHLQAAKERAEADRLSELLSTQTHHAKNVLHALALLTEQNETNEFRTTEVFRVYQKVCDQDDQADPLKIDRVRDLLDEQAFLDITESRRTGGGRGNGTYKLHQLLKDPAAVKRCVGPDYNVGDISAG